MSVDAHFLRKIIKVYIPLMNSTSNDQNTNVPMIKTSHFLLSWFGEFRHLIFEFVLDFGFGLNMTFRSGTNYAPS